MVTMVAAVVAAASEPQGSEQKGELQRAPQCGEEGPQGPWLLTGHVWGHFVMCAFML